jgi:16S rRNA (guanine527-N7)-methyltransferase
VSDDSSPPEPATADGDFGCLAEALAACAIALPEAQLEAVDAYRALLWQWNEQLNLTRHTTFAKFAERDVLDTVKLDIGSGSGVPGLLLSIIRPDLDVSVCDSVGKKAKVLEQMVDQLALPVRVYAARVQDVLELTTFDTLVARAVASIKKMLVWLDPHWDAFDELLLIKGRKWVEERGEARHHGLLQGKELRRVASYESRQSGESVVLRIWVNSDD